MIAVDVAALGVRVELGPTIGKTSADEIHELFSSEHEAMGERGTLERLERGREWDLASTLAMGGAVVFPHAGVLDCGHQVVHGCLDSAPTAWW